MKLILLNEKGDVVHQGNHDATNPHPTIVRYGDLLFVYSHDELVGVPKHRGHYYKLTIPFVIETAKAPAADDVPAEKPAPSSGTQKK